MRKFFGFLLSVLCICCAAIGLTGCGQKQETSRSLAFTLLGDGTYKVSGIGSCTDTEIVIPSVYNDKPVTSIGNYAFDGLRRLTSVTIPDSVTSIGYEAFIRCSGLTSVTIGNSVTSIGDGAFSGCSGLTSVTIPDSVTSIGDWAFVGCSGLTSVTIGNSVTSIGRSAFNGCSGLTSVTIPDSVTSIGWYAFEGCSGLTSVTIPNRVTSIGDRVFYYCSRLTSVTIPDSVTSIGYEAFRGCYKLVEVINKSALNIEKGFEDNGYVGYRALNIKTSGETDIVNKGGYLFYTYDNVNYLLAYVGSNTDLTLPDDYNGQNYKLYKHAFRDCSDLTSVTIGNSVTSIGDWAFGGCSGLTSLTIGNSVTSIGGAAFDGCSGLTSVTIGNSVTSIGDWAFDDCYKLVEVINKSGLNITKGSSDNGRIAYYALNVKKDGISDIVNKDGYLFYTYDNVNYLLAYVGSNTDLTLPDDYNGQNYELNKYAFGGCRGLTSVTIPDSVTSIGNEAFDGCRGLTSVTIPDSVTSIGVEAFSGCSGLTSVIIGNSVTSIDWYAFYGCSGLTSITYKGTIADWKSIYKNSSWNENVPTTCVIHCTDGNIGI